MLNDKGPLMFINTVNTEIKEKNDQKVYDSRYPKKLIRNKETRKVDELEERKLNNIIMMYNKGRPVTCRVYYLDSLVEGIPFLREKETISIQTSSNEIETINIDDISHISIISF